MNCKILFATVLAGAVWAADPPRAVSPDDLWTVYGRDAGGTKYSPLKQVDRTNVQKLKVAWTFHTGDQYLPKSGGRPSAFQSTPLYVDGTLFVTTAFGRILALDPITGKQRWAFDPGIDTKAGYGDYANRGVATWVDTQRKDGAPCRRQLYIATIDAQLIAVDAANGQPCAGFGERGRVDLRRGLRNPPREKSEYEETSPPVVIGGLVVIGSAVADNTRVSAASGEVRAFDARTGQVRWAWDPIPQNPDDPAAKTWAPGSAKKTGAANAWSIMSVDPERNLVFVPTGSASPDYFGGERLGQNLYANSVVALRGDTGKVVWHFQTVHHDLWDYDVASQPLLLTVRQNGKAIPAVAVGSKTGNLFLLHRETGQPLFPVEERPVPKSDVPGEEAWATQPFPTLPAPLTPQRLTAEDAWGPTEEDKQWCAGMMKNLRAEGIFTPPSLKGSLVFPGNIGGMAWGGGAFDPERGLLFVPTNRLAAVVKLVPRADWDQARAADRESEFAPQHGTPFAMARQFLRSPHGAPCTAPPWGTMTAIDAATGQRRWEVPIGYLPWTKDHPQAKQWGSIHLGGPMSTAGGLVFLGATLDAHLRAFDAETGKELWAGELPTSARATPMTYRGPDGKQYVVIAAGGHAVPGIALGDTLVAFALP